MRGVAETGGGAASWRAERVATQKCRAKRNFQCKDALQNTLSLPVFRL